MCGDGDLSYQPFFIVAKVRDDVAGILADYVSLLHALVHQALGLVVMPKPDLMAKFMQSRGLEIIIKSYRISAGKIPQSLIEQ